MSMTPETKLENSQSVTVTEQWPIKKKEEKMKNLMHLQPLLLKPYFEKERTWLELLIATNQLEDQISFPYHTRDMCHFFPSIRECKQGENGGRISW